MRFASALTLLVVTVDYSRCCQAFAPIASSSSFRRTALRSQQQQNIDNAHEFDHLLQETGDWESHAAVNTKNAHSRRSTIIQAGEADAIMVSSVAAGAPAEALTEEIADAEAAAESSTLDPYSTDSFEVDAGLQKLRQMQEIDAQPKGSAIQARFREMDISDFVLTIAIPGFALFAAGRWGFNRVSTRVQDSTEATLAAFAQEMLYHDGNFDEMKLCWRDYHGKKLAWMPNKRDTLLQEYLEAYAKRKTVSPAAISSLSYVFSLAKLSEEQAAGILTKLCKQRLGTDKISSVGKLLFLGSCILKSPEGQAGLVPIKDLIKSTYREVSVAEEMVETSQQAIAEASYRSVVLSGGKQQESLTPGWQVLGLDQAVAERIFQEEAGEGFLTDREAMYGGQTTKYDKKGNILNDDGSLQNPDDAIPDDDEGDEGPPGGVVSNVYECGNCGYTLFIAKGREEKFYGPGFKCPECGAAKKDFQAKDLDGDE